MGRRGGKVLDGSPGLGKFWQGPREIRKEKEHDVFLISYRLGLSFQSFILILTFPLYEEYFNDVILFSYRKL